MSERNHDGRGESQERHGRTAAEWITFALSVAIILAAVGLVVYLYVLDGNDPPVIAATAMMDQVREESETYFVPVAVTNSGDRTAEQVVVEAELTAAGDAPEVSEFTLDFLAGDESETGTAVFSSDPASGELTVDVISFR